MNASFSKQAVVVRPKIKVESHGDVDGKQQRQERGDNIVAEKLSQLNDHLKQVDQKRLVVE